MSEYLIQSSTLEDIADAIRSKTGGSALINPEDMADKIDSIQTGDPYDIARQLISGTLTEYIDPQVTTLAHSAFYNRTSLTSVIVHSVTHIGSNAFYSVSAPLAFPNLTSFAAYALYNCKSSVVDFGATFHANIMNYLFDNATNLKNLIFRYNGIVPLVNIAQSMPPSFVSNGTGGTIYIPKTLYDHLGDGTALDYKSASNWSTIDGYGTITWAQIEGSQYETHYADGTEIS